MKKSQKKKSKFVYFGKIEDFTEADSINYWQNCSAEERFAATVSMAEEVAEMRGIKNVERFLRSVALLKRI